MATPTYIGTYIGAPPGVRQRLTAVPARPCQWKLYRGIQCALEATIPDLYDTYSGGTIRPFKQAMAGRLPSRLADWFEAELKDAAAREILSFSGTPELLGPGWLAALTTTRRFVIEHEITAGKVTQLLVGARSPNPLRPEAPTAIAHVCTIQAMQYEAWRLQGKQRTVRANADRRRFTEAVALLRRQLPDWIRLVDMGSTRFDSYCALLDQLNALPSLPRLGRANFDWQTCATELAHAYRQTVDPECGWSKQGPAVRFIVAVLGQIGVTALEEATVEKAISRRGRTTRSPLD